MNHTKDKILLFIKAIFLLLLFHLPLIAENVTYDEYTFKAVYFGKITNFIKWPESSAIEDATKPFIIGIIGKTPLKEKLFEIYRFKKIRNKNVKILDVQNLSDIDSCHILFIPESEEDEISNIINYTAKTSVLTIADTKGFSQKGIIINIVVEKNGNHNLEVNKQAEANSKISISSKLLKYVTITNSEEK